MSRVVDDVVFDLGGVLVDWNPRYLYRQLIKDSAEMEEFLATVCNSEWNEKQDAGRSFHDGENELIAKFPARENLIRSYFAQWEQMLAGEISGTVEVLSEIARRGQHRLFALSNWSAETFPIARQKFSFFEHFQDILVSGKEKLIKPDARFFNLLTERHDLKPQSSVFIDDVEKNIAGAAALGFQTIHFQNPAQLRTRLQELGVIALT